MWISTVCNLNILFSFSSSKNNGDARDTFIFRHFILFSIKNIVSNKKRINKYMSVTGVPFFMLIQLF